MKNYTKKSDHCTFWTAGKCVLISICEFFANFHMAKDSMEGEEIKVNMHHVFQGYARYSTSRNFYIRFLSPLKLCMS